MLSFRRDTPAKVIGANQDDAAATHFASIVADLHKVGTQIGSVDAMRNQRPGADIVLQVRNIEQARLAPVCAGLRKLMSSLAGARERTPDHLDPPGPRVWRHCCSRPAGLGPS